MPTIISHSIFGSGLAKFFRLGNTRKILMASIILAALPDSDALLLRWVPYDSFFGHRGFTHSLFFALCAGTFTAYFFQTRRWIANNELWKLAVLFVSTTASHGLLDAFTDGGLGVALLSPFDTTRYFFPIRPIPVAPFSPTALLTARGARLFMAEAGMIWTFTIGSLLWNRKHPTSTSKWVAIVFWMVAIGLWVLASLGRAPWQ